MRRNIKLLIEYDGSNYIGWQKQPVYQGESIQGVLERALAQIVKHRVILTGAGRTDSGVHALGQVANFFTENAIPVERIPAALAGKLPRDIVVKDAYEVPESFHARFSAIDKTYRYHIRIAKYPSAFAWRYSCHIRFPLDLGAMKAGASYLIGTHDFSSFCAQGTPVKTFIRTVKECTLFREDKNLLVEITADGFLYNMVRIIVGTLVEVGRGRWIPEKVEEILQARDRVQAGPTMKAEGLTLVRVRYKL